MPDKAIGLYVSVPVACFRVPRAREYFETFPCPPPSTVYGMLLALVGETSRRAHEGAELAIALLSQPDKSTILRTMWRVKNKNFGPGLGENRRPDFQELLTHLEIGVWIRSGAGEQSSPPLRDRILDAFRHKEAVVRFGALSLGESTHLVDTIRLWSTKDDSNSTSSMRKASLLLQAETGDLSLPVWPDHVGANTTWKQYRLIAGRVPEDLANPLAWTRIARA